MALHHAKLVELLLASCCAATNVPLLGAHDFVEAFGRAVGSSPIPSRGAGDGEGFGRGGGGVVVWGSVLPRGLELTRGVDSGGCRTGRRGRGFGGDGSRRGWGSLAGVVRVGRGGGSGRLRCSSLLDLGLGAEGSQEVGEYGAVGRHGGVGGGGSAP